MRDEQILDLLLDIQATSQQLKADNEKFKADNEKFKADNEQIKADNKEIKTELVTVKTELATVKQENKELKLENKQLRTELNAVTARVEAIEDRLALIDERLSNFSGTMRRLLEDVDSLLLDKDYLNLRNSENLSSFSKARCIIEHYQLQDIAVNFKNYKGLVNAIASRLSAFYKQVLGYLPRKARSSQYCYWLEAEELVVEQVVNTFIKEFRN